MTSFVIAPLSYASAVELAGGSGLWRKRILPIGSIDYRGRRINFTRDYLAGLAGAFRSRAYDSVPFQLAGADNKHTNDVERFGGEIVDFDLAGDGLYALVRPTERGERVLRENPKLGVSARIVEEYARSDGRHFPAAIQHVLGTLDPRVPGLGEWQEVAEYANDGYADVIDLSGASWPGEDGTPAGGGGADPLADARAVLSGGGLEIWADLDAAGFEPTLEDVRAVREVLAETSTENAVLGNWMTGTPAPEPSYGLSNDSLEGLEALKQARRAHDLGRATARQLARAALRNDDFMTAARIHIELSQDPYAPGREIDLAGEDAGTAGHFDAATACGVLDAYGRCGEQYHDSSCSAVTGYAAATGSAADATAWREAITGYASAMPAGDGAWQDTSGDPWTVRHAIEQAAGQRLAGGGFETGQGRPELAEAQRQHMVMDEDGTKVPLPPAPAAIREYLAQQAPRLFPSDAAAARDRALSRRVDRLAGMLLSAGPRQTGGLGDGPTFAERREALRRPLNLVEHEDRSLPGAPAVRAYGAGR